MKRREFLELLTAAVVVPWAPTQTPPPFVLGESRLDGPAVIGGWGPPRDWRPGEVLTAAQMNTHIRDTRGGLS